MPSNAATMGEQPLRCDYFDAGLCHSCTWMGVPLTEQLARKQDRAQQVIPAKEWLEAEPTLTQGFRNKVKLVVSGTVDAPTLGILAPGAMARDLGSTEGIDLERCPLPMLGIRMAIPVIKDFIRLCGLQPYRVRLDQGVLKYVIINESPRGELMVRFVVRRRGVQGVIFKYYPWLAERLPMMRVCSINVQPAHSAIVEGEEEIVVSDQEFLPMPLVVSDPAMEMSHGIKHLDLQLAPQSFFQTNTEAAQILYRRARQWVGAYVADDSIRSAWDLYCGVGGFALALASAGVPEVVGVEVSQLAVESARMSAAQHSTGKLTFIEADATQWAREQPANSLPDLIVVNPPRRGIGAELAAWIDASGVPKVLYSSCYMDSMERDLAAMPSYEARFANVVDMFPHTPHFETITVLERRH
ncbi:MAG: methyltransferase domain-containing protein [Actinomycetaceae bacterium]|nr:methyltransferase domain-containing protein [Actinomycetaceae bacterium]